MNTKVSRWSNLIFKYWKIRQWFGNRRTPTSSEADELTSYYNKAIGFFDAIGIDVRAMSSDKQRLYHMMLIYADREEAIMPAASRTATMINFLNSRNHNWTVPPTSAALDPVQAEQIDGYVAVELMNSELKTIYDEICSKIDDAVRQA